MLESHNAYQVAVDGDIRLLPKAEYAPSILGAGVSFQDLFGGIFGQ